MFTFYKCVLYCAGGAADAPDEKTPYNEDVAIRLLLCTLICYLDDTVMPEMDAIINISEKNCFLLCFVLLFMFTCISSLYSSLFSRLDYKFPWVVELIGTAFSLIASIIFRLKSNLFDVRIISF